MDVKICGVCRPGDAVVVRDAGADCIGVILAARGPRLRSPDEAARIYLAAPELRRVGVFVDAPAGLVNALATRLALNVVQLHGNESADTLREVRDAGDWKIWKALRPRTVAELLRGVEAYASHVDGLLVDGFSADAQGGAGVRFPWDEVAHARHNIPPVLQFIVAGGLDAGNVARAIDVLSPDVVDVSSGVESKVGEKDVHRTVAFVNAARAAERRAAPAR